MAGRGVEFPEAVVEQARALLERCRAAGLRVAVAESCTGGLLAGLLTEIPGSSEVFERGFVTYSNEAKVEMLDVPEELLRAYGAVSEEVARAMAAGALARSRADLAVAITGIAGPAGGTPDKPVGLVHFVAQHRGKPARADRRIFTGDRGAVRLASVRFALVLLAAEAC